MKESDDQKLNREDDTKKNYKEFKSFKSFKGPSSSLPW